MINKMANKASAILLLICSHEFRVKVSYDWSTALCSCLWLWWPRFYKLKLRHKHEHKKNQLVHFSYAYVYAYVDPVFTCLHMCLCLCSCLCLYLWDNENRTLTHHICRFCWCTHLQNYKGQHWNIRFCWLRTTCCAGENCQAQKIVNEWNVRIIVWTFSNVCLFVRTKLPIRLAKGTKMVIR